MTLKKKMVLPALLMFLFLQNAFPNGCGINWQWLNPLPQGNYLSSVAFGNGKYVAVGNETIMTSADGLNWSIINTESSSPSSVLYEGGQFVAVGYDYVLQSPVALTSTDGASWETYPMKGGGSDIAYGNGIYISVSCGPFVAVSSDAKEWTTHDIGVDAEFNSVAYGNGVFVACVVCRMSCNCKVIATSRDGDNWSTQELDIYPINDVTFGKSTFVGVGPYGQIITSNDGYNWASYIYDHYVDFGYIFFVNSQFITTEYDYYDNGNSDLFISQDGLSWVKHDTDYPIKGITYGNDQFVGVGYDGLIVISDDGINWNEISEGRGTLQFDNFLNDIAYGKGTLAAVGKGTIRYSKDGFSFSDAENLPISKWTSLHDVEYSENGFIAVGVNGTILTSSDGVAWVLRDAGTEYDLYALVYGNGIHVAVGLGGIVLTSPDGITWTKHNAGVPGYLWEIAYGNSLFIALGEGDAILTSRDGITWVKQAPIPGQHIGCLAFDGERFVASGTCLATTKDGIDWEFIMALSDDNGLIVTCGDSQYVGICNSTGIITSCDYGKTWTSPSPYSYPMLSKIVHVNSAFYVVGNNAMILKGISTDINPPSIQQVEKLVDSFRLKILGNNFHPDAKVYIGSDPNEWTNIKIKSSSRIVLKGGTTLKAKFPKDVPVKIMVVNGDGGSARINYKR